MTESLGLMPAFIPEYTASWPLQGQVIRGWGEQAIR